MKVKITRLHTQAPPLIVGWRGLHEIEGGRQDIPPNMPAVIPPYTPSRKLDLTESIQNLSYDLMRYFCPGMTRSRWRAMHHTSLAMCNRTGYDGINPVARRDYINKQDLTAEFASYDKMQRTFQGSFITGTASYSLSAALLNTVRSVTNIVRKPKTFARYFRKSVVSTLTTNNLITCQPGIDGIDARNLVYEPGTVAAANLLQLVIAKRWYSIAVCAADPPFHFRPNWGGWIVYPFLFDVPITFEAAFFQRWEATEYPNPLQIYV